MTLSKACTHYSCAKCGWLSYVCLSFQIYIISHIRKISSRTRKDRFRQLMKNQTDRRPVKLSGAFIMLANQVVQSRRLVFMFLLFKKSVARQKIWPSFSLLAQCALKCQSAYDPASVSGSFIDKIKKCIIRSLNMSDMMQQTSEYTSTLIHSQQRLFRFLKFSSD